MAKKIKSKKGEDLSLLVFASLAFFKQERKSLNELARQILILARDGIDYLLMMSKEKEKKETTVKKIEIK